MSASVTSARKTKAAMARPFMTVSSPHMESSLSSQSQSLPSVGHNSAANSACEAREIVTSSGYSSLGMDTKPAEVYCTKAHMKACMERKTLHDVCVSQLFPKVKFVNKNGPEMDYSEDSQSICQFVISKCNLDPTEDPKGWWEKKRKVVVQKITAERSNRSAALRWGFYGKCWFSCVLRTV